MDYYQARISIETARLMEQVKRLYENKKGVSITRADVLMSAYEDSLWVNDWQKDVREEPVSIEKVDIKPSAQKLKVHISDDVEQGIKRLKQEIPSQINSRSVTYGVVIEYILKAAYIKNIRDEEIGSPVQIAERKIREVVARYKKNLSKELEIGNSERIMDIIKQLEDDLIKEINRS
ncbi:hypothetical protein [Bacillus cereus group sp. BfR-BA-01331]|uniref:hypothetical protein n=1 Tax=Bacillus cereus group sp. BfR-BA-01331 TaxID=2920307 RepID=UPI001F58D44B|nr:hypothetical protein [Bacillus cereus group sp. BfR-BA-01331]